MLDEKNHTNTYNKGDLLAVTIAPDDKMQGYNTPKRFQDFLGYYNIKFNRLFEECKQFSFYFRLELSEPIGEISSSGPRLHLHGVIKLHSNLSVFKFLNDVMPDLLIHARLEVKHIKTKEQLDGWNAYIHKQSKIMPQNSTLNNTNISDILPSPSGDERP